MINSSNRKMGRRQIGRHVIFASLAALFICVGCVGQAFAQEDEDELPDTKFFKGILRGFGLRNGQESTITYQERPPLVVPPTRDLPPPQSIESARGNAAWPTDQDEKRRREAKQAKNRGPWDWEEMSRQLRPEELRRGAKTAKDDALSRRSAESPEQYSQQYTPSQLGYMGGLFGSMKDFFGGNNKDEVVTFEAEPPRTSLTEPPVGYRAPSPTQPYGLRSADTKAKAQTLEQRTGGEIDQR